MQYQEENGPSSRELRTWFGGQPMSSLSRLVYQEEQVTPASGEGELGCCRKDPGTEGSWQEHCPGVESQSFTDCLCKTWGPSYFTSSPMGVRP
jgi:hypothetical protein